MNLEDQIKEVLVAELQRQAEEGGLTVQPGEDGESARVQGDIDLRSLAAIVVGHVAGGP